MVLLCPWASQQPSHFWMSKEWSGLIELIYLPTRFTQCIDIPWMLHENVMMVLHWRTSSFFVVKCFLLVSSLPNSNRRYTTSFGRFESQCNNIKKLYIHHNLHNFYFNSNLFLYEYFLVLTNFCYLALAIGDKAHHKKTFKLI